MRKTYFEVLLPTIEIS